jgi:hypothetical protein
MAATNPGFQVVRDDTETEQPAAQPVAPAATPAQIIMLTIALKALSQRALTAATDLFSLITVATAFWLWSEITDPNDKQLIALSLYGLMVLAINVIVRRK